MALRTRSGKALAKFGVYVQVVPPGHAEVVASKIHRVADRLEDPGEAWDEAITYLEGLHAQHFSRMRGRYIRTGDTMRSLTRSHAYGAIRKNKGEMRFGTRVWYAHFLTKSPYDVENHQVHKEPPGEGRSAVLIWPPRADKNITEILARHVMEPVE